MTTTVRIFGSRAREQIPGTSITLLAPGFRGAMTQLGADPTPTESNTLSFVRAKIGADIRIAACLSMHLEALPLAALNGLRTRNTLTSCPRLIVRKRKGVAYALLQTDEQGNSSFALPESHESIEAVFALTTFAAGATHRTVRVLIWPKPKTTPAGL